MGRVGIPRGSAAPKGRMLKGGPRLHLLSPTTALRPMGAMVLRRESRGSLPAGQRAPPAAAQARRPADALGSDGRARARTRLPGGGRARERERGGAGAGPLASFPHFSQSRRVLTARPAP